IFYTQSCKKFLVYGIFTMMKLMEFSDTAFHHVMKTTIDISTLIPSGLV
ncbi:unnamed protein product, partial [Heterotrigona itama]